MKSQTLGANCNSEAWGETRIRVLHEHATCGLHVQYQLQDVAWLYCPILLQPCNLSGYTLCLLASLTARSRPDPLSKS